MRACEKLIRVRPICQCEQSRVDMVERRLVLTRVEPGLVCAVYIQGSF